LDSISMHAFNEMTRKEGINLLFFNSLSFLAKSFLFFGES